MSEQTSKMIKFMAWLEEEGESTAQENTYYLASDAAEMFVSKGMPGIFDKSDGEVLIVCVKHPDGKIEKFDVHVVIDIRARPAR